MGRWPLSWASGEPTAQSWGGEGGWVRQGTGDVPLDHLATPEGQCRLCCHLAKTRRPLPLPKEEGAEVA